MRGLLVVLLLTGCGGLSPEFAGTWTGSMVVTVGAETASPAVQSTPGAKVNIAESGGSTLWMTCAGGSAGLRLEGAGNTGTWKGIQSCPTPNANCSTASIVWRSLSASLDANHSLHARLEGEGSDCGYTASVVDEFEGTK